jgi:hypothetical protein
LAYPRNSGEDFKVLLFSPVCMRARQDALTSRAYRCTW